MSHESHEREDGEQDLAAGAFSSWLGEMEGALQGDRVAAVPCGTCTACCTSSQFVHVGPEETDTLAQIPAELLFPAPNRPAGHLLLGYDERGHCPMLGDDGCSIYEHRPRACRTYDCRIFAAAGVMPAGAGTVAVARRAGRWRFSFPTAADRAARAAVRAAAAYLAGPADLLPPTAGSATQRAVLAVRIHGLFLGGDGTPDIDAVREALEPASAASGPRPSRGPATAHGERLQPGPIGG